MEQPFRRLQIRAQRTLWGSCSPRTGTLSFNARLIMAPPAVLDYIVVHELAHFRWRGHGPRFWERVARFCPEHKTHRRWLRENGWRLQFD
jgi:predicted metal-dependent hydrolase